jgi:hypothetical protein
MLGNPGILEKPLSRATFAEACSIFISYLSALIIASSRSQITLQRHQTILLQLHRPQL